MTNALGKNTCNLPVNMDRREHALWGKLAHAEGKSLGQFWRDMALDWARSKQPSVAIAVEDVRRRRAEVIRTGAALFLLACGLHVTWLSIQPLNEHEIYRTRGTVRVWRVRKIQEREGEA